LVTGVRGHVYHQPPMDAFSFMVLCAMCLCVALQCAFAIPIRTLTAGTLRTHLHSPPVGATSSGGLQTSHHMQGGNGRRAGAERAASVAWRIRGRSTRGKRGGERREGEKEREERITCNKQSPRRHIVAAVAGIAVYVVDIPAFIFVDMGEGSLA